MAWVKLGSQSGWTVYWEDRQHRMYARGGGNVVTGDSQKDFSGRYNDRDSLGGVRRLGAQSALNACGRAAAHR